MCGCLLQVDGVDLREATHDKAVEVIRAATSPVNFVVQSLLDPLWVSVHSVASPCKRLWHYIFVIVDSQGTRGIASLKSYLRFYLPNYICHVLERLKSYDNNSI